jgi:hypothetical protein
MGIPADAQEGAGETAKLTKGNIVSIRQNVWGHELAQFFRRA